MNFQVSMYISFSAVISKTLKLAGNFELNLEIALKPRDGQLLEKSLISIATPGSPQFRKYLKPDQITGIVGRSDDEIARLAKFFEEHGVKVTSVNSHKDWISIKTDAQTTQKLFQCKLAAFHNVGMQRIKIGASNSYTIPSEISDLVELVSGMNTFPGKHWAARAVTEAEAAATLPVSPTTIYDLYKSDFAGSHGSKKGSQAVVEFGVTANFNEADTQTFFSQFQPSLLGETTGVVYGKNDGTAKPSLEANLDVQYIMAAGMAVAFVENPAFRFDGPSPTVPLFGRCVRQHDGLQDYRHHWYRKRISELHPIGQQPNRASPGAQHLLWRVRRLLRQRHRPALLV